MFTADPKINPNAKKLDAVTYEEMMELSLLGKCHSGNESVELAKKYERKAIYWKITGNNKIRGNVCHE